MKETYKSYLKEISAFIPRERIYTDEMRRLAWGTDASFYRLVPQIVVRSKTEEEVSRLLSAARRRRLPVTFRAAGTSLSGQSLSDSILIVAGKNWENYKISADAETITDTNGNTLATWKAPKPSRKFDQKAWEAATPEDERAKWYAEVQGARRLLVK